MYFKDLSPQEFIDAVMKFNESSMVPTRGSQNIVPGPATDFDMFYNQRIVGNFHESDPNVINGIRTDKIKDDYFNDNERLKRKKRLKRRKRKIKKFKEFEGNGFGNVDYRDVTGNATTSGYLNDKQPIGQSGAASLISATLPRGNWHEPSTVIVGFKKDEISDPYFLKRKRKKNKIKKNFKDRDRDKISKEINNKYKEDIFDD